MNYYKMRLEDVYKKIDTSNDGLTNEEVPNRLKKYENNKLEDEKEVLESIINIFLHHFL